MPIVKGISLNPSKCYDLDYIHFLMASSDVFSCTKAARCNPNEVNGPSHDAFTRLLQRPPPDTDALWNEVQSIIQVNNGFLIIDDTVLDKLYAKNISRVYRQYSGKSQRSHIMFS